MTSVKSPYFCERIQGDCPALCEDGVIVAELLEQTEAAATRSAILERVEHDREYALEICSHGVCGVFVASHRKSRRSELKVIAAFADRADKREAADDPPHVA